MDGLSLGLSTAAIGMLVVFVGLLVLILCIYAMTSITGHKKKAAPALKEAPAIEAAPAPVAAVQAANDDALIAVITAAVAAVWQGENNGFVVRRVRRCQNSPAWQRSARDEQMYGRM